MIYSFCKQLYRTFPVLYASPLIYNIIIQRNKGTYIILIETLL